MTVHLASEGRFCGVHHRAEHAGVRERGLVCLARGRPQNLMKYFSHHFLCSFLPPPILRRIIKIKQEHIQDLKGRLGAIDFSRSSETSLKLYERLRLQMFSGTPLISSGR